MHVQIDGEDLVTHSAWSELHAVHRTACGMTFSTVDEGPRVGNFEVRLPLGVEVDHPVDCMACVAGVDLDQPLRYSLKLPKPMTVVMGTFLVEPPK